jgi:hypothetical protein
MTKYGPKQDINLITIYKHMLSMMLSGHKHGEKEK